TTSSPSSESDHAQNSRRRSSKGQRDDNGLHRSQCAGPTTAQRFVSRRSTEPGTPDPLRESRLTTSQKRSSLRTRKPHVHASTTPIGGVFGQRGTTPNRPARRTM